MHHEKSSHCRRPNDTRKSNRASDLQEGVLKLTVVYALLLLSVSVPAQNGPAFHGDIASWSGIPPLPPDSGAKQTPHRSAHCTVADAADHVVSVWTTEKACKEWLDEARKLAASGPTVRQIEDLRARQIASEPADPNHIYAMFLCFKILGSCQAMTEIFPTLDACHFRAKQMTPYKPTPDGHFPVPPDMWYECRSKHVDTWEPTR